MEGEFGDVKIWGLEKGREKVQLAEYLELVAINKIDWPGKI